MVSTAEQATKKGSGFTGKGAQNQKKNVFLT